MSRLVVSAVVLTVVLSAAAPAAAAEHVVHMSGANYQPSEIDGRVGDTIRFVNDDTVSHDVFVPTVGHGIDLGGQEPGEEKTMTLGKAGTFEAECVFHGHMLLTVSVKR